MKNILLAIFLAGSILGVVPTANAQAGASKQTVPGSYVRKDLGFVIVPPTGWNPTRKYLLTDMLVAFCKGKDTGYQPIVTISAKDFPTPALPPNFAERLSKNYKDQYSEYSLIGTSHFKIAGKDAVSIAFTARSPRTRVLVDLRRVFVVHQDKLLTFEMIAEVADFDLLVPTFDKMMRTLSFQP